MHDLTILYAWLEFAVRWTHVIVAIAWIGSSFYFIALDLGLHRDRDLASGADGEEWQVHGGGFYHIQKYLIAPERMPGDLTWFKWESYATWLSGFAMLILVYYIGGRLFLIDPAVADLALWQGIAISLASLAFGWLAYNQLCKWFVNADQTLLMLALFGVLVGMSLFYTSVFSGRAALLHLGAFTATIMSANVFMVIIPNQKIVVADLKAGRKPDAIYGKIAKQRSTHNNYLTLPVIFLMLSNHYPLAFAGQNTWAIGSLVFLMGVTIRHWFNTHHARKGNPHWTWGATVIIFLVIVWLSTPQAFFYEEEAAADLNPQAQRLASAEGFSHVAQIVQGRCAMCHAAEPTWPGLYWPPRGVELETEAQIATQARQVYLQAGVTHAMPPANASLMEPAERAAIAAWYRAAN
ncbi:urate hydroxylase PuuD [Pseudoroseicyclus aestuarii]|uniref:Putative membrane protein n=1 Tax=Pseudoroseicyclus aestuarii TaxID=1795041 RepID=A0A318SSX4_9RHOB|nr:urate hydroxylase PuuD [Pseudoroseicyclus aestuarii]PYE84813.1 putative membrane protein [Pseudoroseicyclus aestuarii]